MTTDLLLSCESLIFAELRSKPRSLNEGELDFLAHRDLDLEQDPAGIPDSLQGSSFNYNYLGFRRAEAQR
jgi:hypothetical protein